MKKWSLSIGTTALLLVVTHSYAQTCDANITRSAPDSRYQLVNNGTEVKDIKTGLIWQRCSLGQTWNGTTCTGAATSYAHRHALQITTKIGNGWRLPNFKELFSLVEHACYNPSINEKYFPNTIIDYYWSSSPIADDRDFMRVVPFDGGYSNYKHSHDYYNNHDYVRLVRNSQ